MNTPQPRRQRSCLGRILLYLLLGFLAVSLLGACSRRIRCEAAAVPARELVFRTARSLPGGRLVDAVVPDSHTLLTLTQDRVLRVWDLDSASQRSATLLQFLPGDSPDWALSPDGRRIAGHGALWDLASGRQLITFEADTTLFLERLAFGAEGRVLYGGTFEGPVLRWDTRSGKRLQPLLPDAFESGPVQFLTGRNTSATLAFSRDGRRMAVGTYGGTVTLLRPDGRRPQDRLSFPLQDPYGYYAYRATAWEVSCAAFTPDGRQLVAAGTNGCLYVWDARTGRSLGVIRETPAERILITPDARAWILCAGKDLRFYHVNKL